jgi:prepilin-type N-terminal cleavage/methylation domain-containing protein
MARPLHTQAGLTVIELMIAVTIGAVVLAALSSVVSLGLRAQTAGTQANDLLYQGQFAMERMVRAARGVAPQLLATPAANSTGDWFAPARFCRNAANQLIETTTADNTCAGLTVIASNVTAFSAQLPSNAGAVDKPLGVLSLTLTHSAAAEPLTLTTSVRLGGGTL